ncbi:hypothetical protein D3C87_1310540 [compost metagenome]
MAHGMRVSLYRIDAELKAHIANTIRGINMFCQPGGFASNKGLTDRMLTNPFGFSWYFPSEEARDWAEWVLKTMLRPRLFSAMRIQSMESKGVRRSSFYNRKVVLIRKR